MKKVLVADDKKDIVDSIKDMLDPYYQVSTATTGLEVLRLCKNENYDALILDVDFEHGINGLEVASMLRVNNKEIKILIFSAVDYSDEVRQQVIDVGALFCEKPLGIDLVHRILEDKDKI
jgi:CheY-like chemotaxis protein